MSKLKNVAIIGGGPAGLCTARHLLHYNKGIAVNPVVFEQRDVIGGTWVYEDIDKDKPGEIFSSIYINLKTNLPKQVMVFPDYPYADHFPTYMHHTDVLKYLQGYTDHYKLLDVVRLNTEIVNICPLLDEDITDPSCNRFVKWCVKSSNKITKEVVEEEYDAVVVCNGHYSVPSYPSICGLKFFTGEVMHSHYYRRPEEFSEKDVLILGCGPSAIDIMAELSNYSRTVYFSHRGKQVTSILPKNVIEVPNISHVNNAGHFVFEDNSSAQVDTFLPCTGYSLNFPFMSPQSGIVIEENTILNLYRHIFSISHPSLSFVGLTWKNTPFPAMHQQCQYITKVITETIQLPNAKEMTEDTEKERAERTASGQPNKYFHQMGDRQWEYNRQIAKLAQNEVNPVIIENLYKHAIKFRNVDFCAYKKMEFKAINDSDFETLRDMP